MIRYLITETDWGDFVSVFSDRGLIATQLPSKRRTTSRAAIRKQWPGAEPLSGSIPGPRSVAKYEKQIRDYFAGKKTEFDVPLDTAALTNFRRRVLDACRKIPFGKTAGYRDLARAAGNPAASRAVGSTMAANPCPLVVPCHRVLRADGSLGGFSAPEGVALKKRLLAHEGALPH